MNEEIELLVAEYDLGVKCRDFLNSDVGKYIIGRADNFEKEQLEEFSQCSVKDEENLIKIQSNLKVVLLLKKWLFEAINNGEAANFQLEQQREQETYNE